MSGSVAEGIKKIIRERAYMQSEIARRAGFTAQQFNDMLNNRKIIRADYMAPIACALGVSVQEIYDAGRASEEVKQ
jgi:transcriptional regulator with XRE-family HTH domain